MWWAIYFITLGGLLAYTMHKNIQRRKRIRQMLRSEIDSYPNVRNRSGFALPAVLLLLTVLSIMSVVFLNAGMVEQKASRAMRETTRAFYATNGGLHMLVAEFDSLRYDTLMVTPGDSLNLAVRTLANGTTYNTRLQRIDDDTNASLNTGHSLFSVTIDGESPLGSNSRASMVLRYRTVWPIGDLSSAVFAGVGLMKASSNGMNTGMDACSADSIGGLTIPIGGLDYNGDPSEVFDGNPVINEVADPVQAMNDSGLDWQAILDMEFDYVINNSNQFPDFSTLPTGFYPTILFTGSSLTVRGPDDNGRGMLVVVDGIRMQSDWQWEGAIMVGNDFAINNDVIIEGSLSAGLDIQLGINPAMLDESNIGPGAAQITYNSCAIAKATGWDDEGFNPVRVVNGTWVERW